MIKKLKQIFKRGGKQVTPPQIRKTTTKMDEEKNKRIAQMLEEYCREHPQI